MDEKQLKRVFRSAAEEEVPARTISLWPDVKERLEGTNSIFQKRIRMMKLQKQLTAMIAAGVLVLALAVGALFSPQGRAFAQDLLRFFSRADQDALPVQSWQMTPAATAGVATPDPANILDATLAEGEAAALAGYSVLSPAWLPAGVAFSGASYDANTLAVRQFYQTVESNGFVLKQTPLDANEEASELAGVVGASTTVEEVQVGSATGEYVQGVWNLTENGPVWEDNPWLQTLRWQTDDFAFELLYMGDPSAFGKTDLISIAASLN